MKAATAPRATQSKTGKKDPWESPVLIQRCSLLLHSDAGGKKAAGCVLRKRRNQLEASCATSSATSVRPRRAQETNTTASPLSFAHVAQSLTWSAACTPQSTNAEPSGSG